MSKKKCYCLVEENHRQCIGFHREGLDILWNHYGLLFVSQSVDYRKCGELVVNYGEHLV